MKKKIAAILICLVVLIMLFTIKWLFPGKAQETVYASDNLIRLHVVANSDNQADQDLKRKIRDVIIRNVGPKFMEAQDIGSAREVARANLERIKELAAGEIVSEGKNYSVAVALDSYAFPTKHYGPFVLPAGEYEAVRVVIGTGGGANWWCVLFPPLCFVDMPQSATAVAAEGDPITQLSTGEPLTGTSTTGTATALTEGHPIAASEDIYEKVEFRFRILDFFRSFHWG